jgi:mannose-6-phosphate isomerase-like protein (cupin superfamily)
MVRRVVTGHDGEGRSTVVSDGDAATMPYGSGGVFHLLWGSDEFGHFPDRGEEPRWSAPFPPPGGCRVAVNELPPGDATALDAFVSGGLSDFADPDRPGMHATPTLDIDIVLEGTIGLELDDGEVTLQAGDIVVLNGVTHRWHNRGSTVAKLVSVVIGARHDAFPDSLV